MTGDDGTDRHNRKAQRQKPKAKSQKTMPRGCKCTDLSIPACFAPVLRMIVHGQMIPTKSWDQCIVFSHPEKPRLPIAYKQRCLNELGRQLLLQRGRPRSECVSSQRRPASLQTSKGGEMLLFSMLHGSNLGTRTRRR